MIIFALLLSALGLAMSGWGARAAARRRLRSLGPAPPQPRSPPALRRHAAAILAAVAVAVSLGGVVGVVGAVLAGVGVHRALSRLEPAASRQLRQRRGAQLPTALDLLAICLRSGSPLAVALDVVSAELGGPLAADLAVVAGLQRLGASVPAAWSRYEDDPVLGLVVRSVHRSARSGSALASAFERLAAQRRATARVDAEGRAQRAGVLAVAPLGLCFLPAFVCLGIVPLVVSIAEAVFG
jgi:Flp pilus assembly protein TadB